MVTVAVTGASGYLGRKVVTALESAPDISRVVGIDIADPDYTTRHLEFYRIDVRSPELGNVVSGCDAIVHLAAVSGADAEEVRDTNIGGTRSVTDAAERAGARVLVYASSHAVYGAHADNDFPLTEESLLRPSPDNAYATSKVEAESVIGYFASAHPDVAVSVLRLAWVSGPTIPGSHAAVIDAPVRLVVDGYDPPFQTVHEEDAAGAILFALETALRGTYNICADDTVDRPEEVIGQRRLSMDLDRARRLLDRASKVGLGPVAPAEINTLIYPQVMSNSKIWAAGFRFEYSAADALRAAAETRRGWVAMGKYRFRPRRAAVIAGSLGLALVGSAARRAVSKARKAKRESS